MKTSQILAACMVAQSLGGPLTGQLLAQSKPTLVSEIRGIGYPATTMVNSIAVSGRYAWVGTTDGLFIYDVSTPSNPRLAGAEPSPQGGPIHRIVITGSYAYLANVGLRIVEITNPVRPSTVSYTDDGNNGTNGLAMDLAVEGQYVYVANGADGLRVYDVSSVYSPTNIGHWPNPNSALGNFRMGITVAGNYAYLAAFNDGLRVFDVSNPRNPVNTVSVPDGKAADVAVVGNRLYLISTGLSIYDITTPSQPVLLCHTNDMPTPIGLAVSGNFAYVGASGYTYYGPYFYDVSDSSKPVRLAPKSDVSSAQGIWDLTIANNHAFMVMDFGVGIYSLGAPTPPTLGISKGNGRSVVLSWPTPSLGFQIQENPALSPGSWTTVPSTNVVLTTTNGYNRATIPTGKGDNFFRLAYE